MAITFSFVGATPNRAVYKLTSLSGGDGTLPNAGGATPDLSTDIPAGTPLGDYLRQTVANSAAAVNLLQNTTRAQVTVQSSLVAEPGYFTVQAVQDEGSELPALEVHAEPQTTDSEAFLTIELFHSIAK